MSRLRSRVKRCSTQNQLLRLAPVISASLCVLFLLIHYRRTPVSVKEAADRRGELLRTVRLCYDKGLPRLAKPTACNPRSVLNFLLVNLLLLSGDIHCNPGPFRLQYYNARSLLNKIPGLQSDLSCNPADAVCVSETWLGDSVQDHEIFGPEYAVFRKDRRGRGGGVLIAVKHEGSPTRRADLECPNSELVWTQLNCRGGKLLLGSFTGPLPRGTVPSPSYVRFSIVSAV
ncbi:hypothetical protein HPB48_027043 [Haemaphysalis longicornis]|uniref:Uncharacterized protein n=1 Tax=Haemaphysalis longicornis TaxID=44386 RepID=A0A9J6H2T8_HAELO|nr:hypothetical protein HPB48_027043 [Haemaphysalis longicornis]